MPFKSGDLVAVKIPYSGFIGDLAEVVEYKKTAYFDYKVRLDDGQELLVREHEIEEIKRDNPLLKYSIDDYVTYIPTGELATITKIDYMYNQLEITFEDESTSVVDLNVIRGESA